MLNVSLRPQPAAIAGVSALAGTSGETSSDEFLVEQIAAGSKPAMQTLFARHRTYVYRWLLRFVSNETLAEDLLSEVFLDVWRQAGRFECRSSVSTWLMSIARHKALSACRRRTDAELDEKIEATIADPADDPEVALQEKDRDELLRRALTRLSPERRQVIDLVYYHEKSVDEVARILDVPPATVKTRMFYAQKKLAELVQGGWEKKSDHRHHRLLRARGERPSCRDAEQREELASLYVEHGLLPGTRCASLQQAQDAREAPAGPLGGPELLNRDTAGPRLLRSNGFCDHALKAFWSK
jgi:RNA polymerase sigma-70 factor, ECF subfamily